RCHLNLLYIRRYGHSFEIRGCGMRKFLIFLVCTIFISCLAIPTTEAASQTTEDLIFNNLLGQKTSFTVTLPKANVRRTNDYVKAALAKDDYIRYIVSEYRIKTKTTTLSKTATATFKVTYRETKAQT